MNKAKISAFMNKKIAGVKVLYLTLVVVLIVAWYAWRTTKTSALDSVDDAEETEELAADDDPAAVFPKMSQGTVYSTTPPADEFEVEDDSDGSIQTNDEWMTKGVGALVDADRANALTAQLALQKYLNGNDISYQQGLLVDYVIGKIGMPPTLGDVGSVGSKPSTAKPAPKPTPKPTAKPHTPGKVQLNLAAVHKDGADFTWKISEEKGTDGIIFQTSWLPDFSKLGHNYKDTKSPTKPRSQKSKTQYYARAYAYNGNILGPVSNTVAYKTK